VIQAARGPQSAQVPRSSDRCALSPNARFGLKPGTPVRTEVHPPTAVDIALRWDKLGPWCQL